MNKPANTYSIERRPGGESMDPGAALGAWVHASSAAEAQREFVSRFSGNYVDFSEGGNFRCRLRHRGVRNYVPPTELELRAYEARVARAQRRLISRRFGVQAGRTANYFWVSGRECASEPSSHQTKITLWENNQKPMVLETIGRVGRRLRHKWRELG